MTDLTSRPSTTPLDHFWAVVPAGGAGTRLWARGPLRATGWRRWWGSASSW